MSIIRSCLECRRRKIRCDKDLPCSYCVRTGVQCEYPTAASSRSKAQTWPTTPLASSTANTTSRIQALENQVQRLASILPNVEGRRDETKVLSPWQTSDVSLESWLAHPTVASNASTTASTGFALRLSPESEITAPQWSIDHARLLWQIYLTDIDPCFNIVDHQYVEDTLNSYPNICPSGRAVLFAIAFAVTSCKTPSSLASYHGYAKALEAALQGANVLTQPSIPTLQALTIYLSCGRLNMDQEYLCTMLLLLVRLATKLRLNQDPGDLGFEPRECEHRRRLWWHIVALDVRTAEACDSTPLIVSRQIETKIPSMSQDVLLGVDEGFESSGHAPCTCYAIMGFEMAKIARQVLFAPAPTEQQMLRTEHQQRDLCDQLHPALLTQYLKTCSCADSPLCRLTMQWSSIYWTRLKLLVSHSKRLFLRQVTVESAFDPERDLLECIGILDRVARLRVDAEYARWAWLWQNSVEWDASAIALSLILTGKCSIEVVSRAWIALDSFFQIWSSGDFGDSAHRRRWSELLAFRDWVRVTSSNIFSRKADDVL